MSRDPLTGESVRGDRYESGAAGLWGLPGDLALVICYTAVAWLLLGFWNVLGLAGPLQGVLRVVLGLPLLVFAPGYALLAALFPGRPSRNDDRSSSLSGLSRRIDTARSIQQRGIQWGERAALSFGMTIFLIPPIALAIDLVATNTGGAYETRPIVGALSAFVIVVSLVGAVRRLRLPREQRFAVPVGYWFEDLADGFSGSLTDVVLNAVLLVSILTAVSTMAFALAEPNPGSESTTLTVDAADAADIPPNQRYPTNFTEGESQPLVISVINHEREPVNYTVVVQLQRIEDGTVTERRNLDRFSRADVPNDRTWVINRTITPQGLTGDNLRLAFLPYRGDPPEDTTLSRENTWTEPSYLGIDVTASGG